MMKKYKIIYIFICICLFFTFGKLYAVNNETILNVNGKEIKFSYELKDNLIENLKCESPELIQGKFEMPESIDGKNVLSIGEYAFFGATNMTEINLPKTVTDIFTGAFENCEKLQSIDLNCTEFIDYDAFKNCTSLNNIKIPKTIKRGANAGIFTNCKSLTTVYLEEGLEIVPHYFFYNSNIQEIVIPRSVKKIEYSAFEFCENLCKVDLGNVEELDVWAFKDCTSLEEIVIPKSLMKGPYSYSVSKPSVFYNCPNLKKVTLEEGLTIVPRDVLSMLPIEEIVIPKSVKRIEMYAFRNCTNLSKVDFGQVERIGAYAFQNCNELREITLPKTLVPIAPSVDVPAFGESSNITHVTLEDGLKVIPEALFWNTSIEEIVIPKSVETIEASVFKNCTKLKKIIFLGNVDNIYYNEEYIKEYFLDNTSKELTVYCYKGTKVEKYAKAVGINYEYLPSMDISLLSFKMDKNYVYTGNLIKPNLKITYNDYELVEGKDYVLSFENNKNIGTATVTITGIVEFCGTKTLQFNILNDISKASITGISNKTYTGKPIYQKPVVKIGKTTLKEGKDYLVNHINCMYKGTATVEIVGIGKYTGKISKTFKISAKSITKFTFSKVKNYTYTGKAISPNVTVKNGKKALVKNTDYTLTYSKNKNKGTATITVTGIGNYTGTKKITFKISARKISSSSISGIANKTYNKSKQTQSIKITYNGITLKNKTDYTVSYKNNKNKGTATVTITGKGNFTGTVKKTFKIKARNINELTISNVKNYTYTGKYITPSVTIKYGSTKLKKGTDYTVKYSSNKKIGTATITITGKGNYTGTKKITFKINAISIEKATVTGIKDKMFTGKNITQSITVKLGSKKLKNKTDYTITYLNNIKIGTATVIIKGKGIYKGEILKRFNITYDRAKYKEIVKWASDTCSINTYGRISVVTPNLVHITNTVMDKEAYLAVEEYEIINEVLMYKYPYAFAVTNTGSVYLFNLYSLTKSLYTNNVVDMGVVGTGINSRIYFLTSAGKLIDDNQIIHYGHFSVDYGELIQE